MTMQVKIRKTITMVLVGLGLSIHLYGFNLHVLPVYSQKGNERLATQERQIVLAVSRGGLSRHADGTIHKTYTGSPPNACPT